jgi:hypothetical protein
VKHDRKIGGRLHGTAWTAANVGDGHVGNTDRFAIVCPRGLFITLWIVGLPPPGIAAHVL